MISQSRNDPVVASASTPLINRATTTNQVGGSPSRFGPKKYSMQGLNGYTPKEHVGNFQTKDSRMSQVLYNKSANFKLGYTAKTDKTNQYDLKKELEGGDFAVSQKWKPAMRDMEASKNFKGKQINWQYGEHGQRAAPSPDRSTGHMDFPQHAIQGQFSAAERQELNNRLRQSSVPEGYEKFPISTAQESYIGKPQDMTNSLGGMSQKEASLHKAKTNMHFGSDQNSYSTQNGQTLKQPDQSTYAQGMSSGDRALIQRKQNFSLGYIPSPTDKVETYSQKTPALQNKSSGKNQINSVVIAPTSNAAIDQYTSVARTQQQSVQKGANQTPAQLKAEVEATRKNLRAVHFSLGNETGTGITSQNIDFTSPAYPDQQQIKREQQARKTQNQSPNFHFTDGVKGQPTTSATQANAHTQRRVESGSQVHGAAKAMPHQSNLQLGSSKTSYETEAKNTFKGAGGNDKDRNDSKIIRDKYMMGDNLHFGRGTNDYQTQAVRVNDVVQAGQSNTMAAKAAAHQQLVDTRGKMRQANFHLGMTKPEHNKYSVSNLENGSRPNNFHQTAQGILQPGASAVNSSPKKIVGGVSSEGMIGRGLPNNTGVQHLTTNQSYIKWIQPQANN